MLKGENKGRQIMSDNNEWWQGFFDGLYQEVHQRLYSEESTVKEVEMIKKYLDLKSGSEILDVPCGNGRLTVELATRGYKTTGYDITEPYLAVAKKSAEMKKVDVIFDNRDMRDIRAENKFNAVICMGGSFAYFDDDGNMEFLKAVLMALKPGGKFMLDTHIAESLFPKYQPRGWMGIGKITVLEDRQYNLERGSMDTVYTMIRGDKKEVRPSSVRIYTYRQLCTMLEGCGFDNIKAYDSSNGEPFKLGSSRLLLLAVK